MRVNNLHIICIRKHDLTSLDEEEFRFEQPQFEEEARALALRCLILERADTVDIVQCSPFMYTKTDKGTAIDERTHTIDQSRMTRGAASSSSSPRIGAYVIAEGSTTGIGSLSPPQLAQLLKSYGLQKLDKLSLISCNIGSTYPNDEIPLSWKRDELTDSDFKNYVARACGVLGASQMGNGTDGRLMVAGWTTFVTVAYPGRRETSMLGKKTTKAEKWETMGWNGETSPNSWRPDNGEKQKNAVRKMNSGRKYAQDAKLNKQPAHLINQKPKVFYTWSKTNGLRQIMEADWTDNPDKK